MAKQEINIIIRARNALAAGLSSVGKSLQSFGSGVLKVGKWLTVGFLAGATALAAFAAKAISAYAEQEAAHRSLAAALDAQGQSAKALLPLLVSIAEAIQDETGADAEATVAGMAKMRMLGVQTSKLGEAARAVIALKGVGLDEAAAQKAVAMAMQGNYDMLKRYVPALRDATTETEKARIVNDLFTKGYEQQKNQLNTVSGQWGLLKTRLGDVWEEIGRGIAGNEGLMRVLRRAGDAVKAFGERIRTWVDSERFKAVATSIEGIVAAMAGGGEDRAQAFTIIGNVLKFSLLRGAELAVDLLKTAAPVIGKLIGAAARMAWESLTGASISDKGEAKKQLRSEGKLGGGKLTEGDWFRSKDENKLVEARAKEIQQARLMKEYGLDDIKTIEGKTEAQVGLDKALEAAGAFGKEQAAKEKIRSDAAADAAAKKAAIDQTTAQKKIDGLTQIENLTAAITAVEKEKAALVAAELKATNKQIAATNDQISALGKELAIINKKKALVEALAGTRVNEYIQQQKEKKDVAKEKSKEAARAKELSSREDRKITLSKKDKEFLEAYNKISIAGGKKSFLDAAGKQKESQIEMAQSSLAAAQASAASLGRIETSLAENLVYSGS